MKVTFTELFRLDGTVDRATYTLVGILGFALKHNLDRFVASYVFHRPWGFFNYLVPLREVGRITDLHTSEAEFLATMLALSLPFIWVGVILTIKRLRSAAVAPQLAILFFIPVLNLLFFLALCLLPERIPSATQRKTPDHVTPGGVLPHSAPGSAALSLLITVPFGVGLAVFGSQVLANYGWGIFVALPFAMGFAAAYIYGTRTRRTLKASVGVACLSVVLVGAALLAIAVEGLICLIMAAPLALPLAAFGGFCAHQVQQARWARAEASLLLPLLLFTVPGLQWAEHRLARQPSVYVVQSAIEIHASPETVWHQVVAFSQIPPPTEWMFRAGIAYPIRAEITGSGPGAVRHCVFSTGAFVEPIEVWDEPHRLKFSVTSNPPPLEEWTPYPHIDPPHLHGFLESQGGEFLLTLLPNGGTRLVGTTWYRHGLWPGEYWKVWSDLIIHRIHVRVLAHIRDESERTQSAVR